MHTQEMDNPIFVLSFMQAFSYVPRLPDWVPFIRYSAPSSSTAGKKAILLLKERNPKQPTLDRK